MIRCSLAVGAGKSSIAAKAAVCRASAESISATSPSVTTGPAGLHWARSRSSAAAAPVVAISKNMAAVKKQFS